MSELTADDNKPNRLFGEPWFQTMMTLYERDGGRVSGLPLPGPDGVLDLRAFNLTSINAGGTNSREIILPESAVHVDVRHSPELRKLVLPRGVKTADLSDCPALAGGLVMQGLPERVTLCDSEAMRADIRQTVQDALSGLD